MSRFPPAVERLFWDVDPSTVDLGAHRDYVMERVMNRGSWEAMQWLQRAYPAATIRDYVQTRGATTLTPQVLAYWALVSDADVDVPTGGGRPKWAGA